MKGTKDKTLYKLFQIIGERLTIPTLFMRVAKPDENSERDSLMVQWLGLGAFAAVGLGAVPGWGTKTPQAEMFIRTKQTRAVRGREVTSQCYVSD